MKRKDFIAVIEEVMSRVQKSTDKDGGYICVHLQRVMISKGLVPKNTFGKTPIALDFWEKVFQVKSDYFGDAASFGAAYRILLGSLASDSELKEMRLNALAMYLAQSLAFKTYKNIGL